MLNSLKKSFLNYTVFSGRATRSEFWTFMLLFALMTVGAHYIDMIDGTVKPIAGGMGILELVVFLVLLLPTVTVSARRLHDSNRSGWWLLFFYLPYVAFVASKDYDQLNVATAAAFLTGTAVLLVLLCLPGDAQENRFGPPVSDSQ